MKRYIISESQFKKIVDHLFNEGYKIEGHEYEIFKTKFGTIKAGKDGILGDHNILIPWNIIIKLLERFNGYEV